MAGTTCSDSCRLCACLTSSLPAMVNYTELEKLLHWDLEPYLPGNPFISSEMTVKQVSALALADSFYKKLCPGDGSPVADEAALIKFKRINDQISSAPWDFAANDEQEATFWDYFTNNFRNALQFEVEGTNYDLSFIREHMAVGPGASQKAVGNDFISKLFDGPVSYTSEFLIPLYRSALADTGLWADAERLRSSKFPFVKVNGGKLFFAKKNAEISRTCCTEANLNMLVQMSIGAFIETRLEKYFGISLSTQPDRNRELARLGSIFGTYGTIDLVSASDSISWQLMLRILDESFLKRAIKECRCEKAVLPDGSEVVLNMISTMGNGFTFPLQTLIFACVVKSVYEMMNIRATTKVAKARTSNHPSETSYGVFGDDIVVCSEAYGFVAKMLNKLGFEVNHAKSFSTGPFRESCGSDWLYGQNVRGVYIRSLETLQQVYSACNRLLRWSARTGIPLVRTVNQLRRWAVEQEPKALTRVPPSESDDAGFKVPFRASQPKVSNRYWYHYRYYKRLVRRSQVAEGDEGSVCSTFTSGVRHVGGYGVATDHQSGSLFTGLLNDDSSLQHQARDPAALRLSLAGGLATLGGYARRPYLTLTDENRDDYLMGKPIRDSSRPLKISLRDPSGVRPRYKLAKREIPYWDYCGEEETLIREKFMWYLPLDEEDRRVNVDGFSSWERTVLATLSW